MKDTHPDIEEIFVSRMMALTGSERMIMGCSMFEAAKSMVKSAILRENPALSERELKAELFMRFYKEGYDEAQAEHIRKSLTNRR